MADGGFIGKRGDIAEPEQKAVLLYLDGVEDLILQVQYDGAVDDFAWVVPLPSRPDVEAVDSGVFDALRAYTLARSRWNAYSLSGHGSGRGSSFGGPGIVREEVTVYEHKRVGVYDVAVLGAESLAALVDWCTSHGYRVPDEARPVLQSYVDRGWIFTAMRIDPAAKGEAGAEALKAGDIQAMRFSFRSDEAIYPLRISSINRGASDVLVYVLAEDSLVHPEFLQRHPAPLREFVGHHVYFAERDREKSERAFSKFFDSEQSSYRGVDAEEVTGASAVLPRWGRRTLHLTALQRTFEPEDMAFDVVFEAPELLAPEAQARFVSLNLKQRSADVDPLLLRMPEAAASVIDLALEKVTNRGGAEGVLDGLKLLTGLEGARAAAILERAAGHPVPEVADRLASLFEEYQFTRIPANVLDDPVVEGPSCEGDHNNRPGLRSCHYHLGRKAGVSAEQLEPALKQLFLREDPPEASAKLLAALGTVDALELLRHAVRGDLDGNAVPRKSSRRFLALQALRHVTDPGVPALIREVFRDQKDSLTEQELLCCLVGLWNNVNGNTEGQVLQIEGYCREQGMTLAAKYANRLLVNRLGVRQPVVEIGMSLEALEDALGGGGVVEKQLTAGGVEVIRYQWGAGMATVKGGALVKWKPVRR